MQRKKYKKWGGLKSACGGPYPRGTCCAASRTQGTTGEADCHVGLRPPRNDTSSVSLRLTPSPQGEGFWVRAATVVRTPQGEGGGFRAWGRGKRIATQWSNAEQVPLGYDQSADWSRNDRIRAGGQRFAVLNDRPVACQTRGPTDPQGERPPLRTVIGREASARRADVGIGPYRGATGVAMGGEKFPKCGKMRENCYREWRV